MTSSTLRATNVSLCVALCSQVHGFCFLGTLLMMLKADQRRFANETATRSSIKPTLMTNSTRSVPGISWSGPFALSRCLQKDLNAAQNENPDMHSLLLRPRISSAACAASKQSHLLVGVCSLLSVSVLCVQGCPSYRCGPTFCETILERRSQVPRTAEVSNAS